MAISQCSIREVPGQEDLCTWNETLSEYVCTNLVATKLAGVKSSLRKHKDVMWHTQCLIRNISCADQIHPCPTLSPIHQIAFSVMAFYSLYRLNTGGFLEKVINLTDTTSIAERSPLESMCYQLPDRYLPHIFRRIRNDQLCELQFSLSNR